MIKKMTVKMLIEELSKYEDDYIVEVEDGDGYSSYYVSDSHAFIDKRGQKTVLLM